MAKMDREQAERAADALMRLAIEEGARMRKKVHHRHVKLAKSSPEVQNLLREELIKTLMDTE